MPIYDMYCTKCSYKEKDVMVRGEELYHLLDKGAIKCPQCHEKTLNKEFSANVHFTTDGSGVKPKGSIV